MTLRQLLRGVSYNSIFNALYAHYYYKDPEESVIETALAYRRAIQELLTLSEASKSPVDEIIISVEEGKEAKAEFIEVNLYNRINREITALDLLSWKELIDCTVRTPSSMPPATACAHILWEITFYGFTNAAVEKEFKNLQEQSKRGLP